DKLVVAHAKIGQILWKQSCPLKEQPDGSCVKITRERATIQKKVVKKKGKEVYVAPKQCGPDSKIKIQVVKRDASKMAQALGEFRAAEQEFAKMKGDSAEQGFGGARYWLALGKF